MAVYIVTNSAKLSADLVALGLPPVAFLLYNMQIHGVPTPPPASSPAARPQTTSSPVIVLPPTPSAAANKPAPNGCGAFLAGVIAFLGRWCNPVPRS